MLERVAIAAVTTATTAAVGLGAEPVGQYGWIAALMPMFVGVIMVVTVRALIDMKTKKKNEWRYNALVMFMCSVFAAVIIHEKELSVGVAMLVGMGAGSMGIGILSYGKIAFAKSVGMLNDFVNPPSK